MIHGLETGDFRGTYADGKQKLLLHRT